MLPRAATSPELARQRMDGQWSTVAAVIVNPPAVYTARVNGAPGTTDQLAAITYDGGAGTLADVLPGMTIFVGSTAGAYDKGQGRIRKAPSSTIFYIGTESEIAVADNDFLTVVDEFGLWQKRVVVAGGVIYMDEDVVYAGQNASRLPVVVMGGPCVLEIPPGLTSVVATFDASGSWVPGGGAKTYAWVAPGSASSSGMSTAIPLITYNAAGRYRVSCTVTIGGVSNTRYEYVYVLDATHPPATQFQFRALTGSKGPGYSFSMAMLAEAGLATVRDRAQVILFSRDHYGGTPGSMGYAAGRENILAIGWIDGESIVWSPELSLVTFNVASASAWLDRVTAYPQGLEDVTTAPAKWDQYNVLTVTAMLWHLLTWRSTVAQAIDCIAEISSTRAVELSAAATSLWEQIGIVAGQKLLAAPATDHLGRLFVLIDSQFRADRSGVAEVMTLTKADWIPPITFNRAVVPTASMVDLNGFSFDGVTADSLFSLSPGRMWGHFGRVLPAQSLLLDNQGQANTLAGLVAGQANNEIPSLTVKLAGNYRLLDVAPDCYVKLTLAAADTPRGIAFTNRRFIVRRISWAYDSATGVLLPTVDLEAETFADIGVTGDSPPVEPPPVGPPAPTCAAGFHWDAGLLTCVADSPPPAETGSLTYAFMSGRCIRSRNFLDAEVPGSVPHWEDCSNGLTGADADARLFPAGPKNGSYRVKGSGLYRSDDLDSTPPTWSAVLLATDIQAALGITGVRLDTVHSPVTEPSACYVGWYADSSGGMLGCSYSADGATGWSHGTIVSGIGTSGTASNPHVKRLIADPLISGRLMAVASLQNFSFNSRIAISTTHGATWSTWYDLGFLADLLDMDISYPDGGATMIMLAQDRQAWYDYTGDAFPFRLAQVLGGSGSININRYHCLINVATLNRDDILMCVPPGDATRFYRSTDRGLTWSLVYTADYGSGGLNPPAFVQAVGRWPGDPDRVWWLSADDGADGTGGGIWYTDDNFATVHNKIGDALAVIGAVSDLVQIIPVW